MRSKTRSGINQGNEAQYPQTGREGKNKEPKVKVMPQETEIKQGRREERRCGMQKRGGSEESCRNKRTARKKPRFWTERRSGRIFMMRAVKKARKVAKATGGKRAASAVQAGAEKQAGAERVRSSKKQWPGARSP